MIYEFLPKLINMSLTAGITVLVILVLRAVLGRAPKVFSFAMWFVLLFRLLCPVSFSSDISLFGMLHVPAAETGSMEYIPGNIVHMENPQVDLPGNVAEDVINKNLLSGEEQLVADPLEFVAFAGTYIWLAGIGVMTVYSMVSLWKLRKRLIGTVRVKKNIYVGDDIVTPFVLGVFRPKIYLPSHLCEKDKKYILLHEQYHIKRLDHISKLLFFCALCIHWFNPLVWLAYYLFVRDMEMSCDEAVMGRMGAGIKSDYSASLLRLATGRQMIAGVPIAFGENNIKARIKNVLNWKKSGVFVITLAVIACIIAAACLMTNPKEEISVMADDDIILAADGNEVAEEGIAEKPQAAESTTEESVTAGEQTGRDSETEKIIQEAATYESEVSSKTPDFDESRVLIPIEQIASMKITNGDTGTEKVYTPDASGSLVSYGGVLSKYHALTFSPTDTMENRFGYKYCIRLYNEAGECIQTITPYKDALSIDGVMYDIGDMTENHTSVEFMNAVDLLFWQDEEETAVNEQKQWVWPTVSYTFTNNFGEKKQIDDEIYFVDYINIAGEAEDEVYAALDGTVEKVGFHTEWGNYIVILSDGDIRTRYGHLSRTKETVMEGAVLKAGDVIGLLGKTGTATGDNLQFAVTVAGKSVDPMQYFMIR